MKNQTYGVEVEMNHITRPAAAKLAAQFFGTDRYENTAYRNGYSAWSRFPQGCQAHRQGAQRRDRRPPAVQRHLRQEGR